MSCINKIDRYFIPNDIVVSISQIYSFIGKNEYFIKTTKNNLGKILEDTIQRDCYFLARLIGLDITDTRMRLIISKDSNPRTQEEAILFNLKKVLANIQFFATDIHLTTEKMISYMNQIYNVRNVEFKSDEIKEEVDAWSKIVDELTDKGQMEKIYLNIHYAIDIFNIAPLNDHNDLLFYICLYTLLLNAHTDCFKYSSLFEIIYSCKDKFIDQLNDTKFNWDSGHAQTNDFIRLVCMMVNDSYIESEKFIRDYTDELSTNKTDAILNTIYRLPRTFTKEDIRAYHPFVSESTINRVLMKLRENESIKPTGYGRSAKWVKIGIF